MNCSKRPSFFFFFFFFETKKQFVQTPEAKWIVKNEKKKITMESSWSNLFHMLVSGCARFFCMSKILTESEETRDWSKCMNEQMRGNERHSKTNEYIILDEKVETKRN